MKNYKPTITMLLALFLPFLATAKIVHLMPSPRQVEVEEGVPSIVIRDRIWLEGGTERINKAAALLLNTTIGESKDATHVEITIDETMVAPGDYALYGYEYEGYVLDTGDGKISITAQNEVGVIRALQTLSQLIEGWEDGVTRIEACRIVDYPAFKLRGFMHDVGRSFIPFEELKKQLLLFARFKVNTFHFHLTENQAWRFEVKAYPQLTSAESMTRFRGLYYTQEQCKELEELAYNLGITVIPEIDMPGHSDAFERAMGHTMQSTAGINELKTILEEVVSTFPHAPYIHIGADETAITYPNFLQTMCEKLHTLGKKVAVWNPASGINITKNIGVDLTQMWSTAGKAVAGLPNIDCRYNYINHFDLFADLVGIYKSNIYYAQQGSEQIAGEISGIWNDRNLASSDDIIVQNNVYATVLAACERAWKGGGKQYIEQGGTVLPLSGDELNEFLDWEERFIFHKSHSLQQEPIAYVRQGNVRWTITDAFPNNGDKNAVFAPEIEGTNSSFTYQNKTYFTHEAIGAGIYLRHTWGTIVPSFYDNPQINHTAYAWTYVYSPEDQKVGALVEFQNYGRSEKDLAPENGQWDRKGSRIWLNDVEIIAPDWDNSGESIDNETLLKNENCTARKPTQLTLNQGWNKVFLKLPYVAVNGVRLNKWMFTFVITDTEGKSALDNIEYYPSIPTSISGNPLSVMPSSKVVYDISGQKIASSETLSTGVYIVKDADGFRKVAVNNK